MSRKLGTRSLGGLNIRSIGLAGMDAAYLAGLLDMKGIFGRPMTVNGRGYRQRYPRIVVTSSDGSLIGWLQDNLGGNAGGNIPKSPLAKQTIWRWTVTGSGAIEIAQAIHPHLRFQREKVEQYIPEVKEEAA